MTAAVRPEFEEPKSENLREHIRKRLGVLPTFFAVAPREWMEYLWLQAEFSYLDNPIPSLFKEQLIVRASRHCGEPYVLLRHAAFLRFGPLAGQPARPKFAAEELVALLSKPAPSTREVAECLQVLSDSPALEGGAFVDSRLESCILECALVLFLRKTVHAYPDDLTERCQREVRRVLGEHYYLNLIALLGFVQTAHDWTRSEPAIEIEPDVRAMLAESQDLADWVEGYTEQVAAETRARRGQSPLPEVEGGLRSVDRLEQASQLAESRFRALFSSPHILYFLLKPDGGLLEANSAAHRFRGLQPGDVADQALWEAPWFQDEPNGAESLRAALADAAAGREVQGAIEVDGRDREETAEVAIRSVRDSNGKVWMLVAEGRITTARKRIEQALRESNKELQALSETLDGRVLERTQELRAALEHSQKVEAIGALASGVAHDFNNVLSAISGFVELAEQSSGDEGATERLLAEIKRATDHGRGLTDGLLNFSRKRDSDRRPLRLDLLVGESVRLLQRLVPASIDIRVSVDATYCWIDADPTQIYQVLTNLVLNGRDAMPDGGSLSVRLSEEQGSATVLLEVEDHGCGMDAETLEQIFEPFHTTKPEGEGTGLGLAIVAGIMEEHGGSIELNSVPSVGTVASLRFPIVAAPRLDPQAREEPLARGNQQCILLVEDDEQVRVSMRGMLEVGGYQVVEAADGVIAVDVFEQARSEVALALIDLELPRRDGVRCVEFLRRIAPELPVLYVSGNPGSSIGKRAEESDVLIPKPFRLNVLLSAIADKIELRN